MNTPLVSFHRKEPAWWSRPNDATALYEALQLLIDDPALRDRMGLSARRLSESLALDAAAFRGFDPADVPAPAEAGLRLAEAV